MQCAQLAHDKQRAFIVESHVRRYRKLGFSPAPQGYDVYIEFASDIELTNALTDPCGRNIDLEDAMAVVDLDIIENMICSFLRNRFQCDSRIIYTILICKYPAEAFYHSIHSSFIFLFDPDYSFCITRDRIVFQTACDIAQIESYIFLQCS